MRRSPGRPPAIAVLAALGLFGAACATNPVTGDRELKLISQAREIRTGERHYDEARRSQGGDFRADAALGEYLSEVGHRVAAVSGRPDLPYEFTVINSSEPNAWALPGGKIGVTRGLLLQLETEDELAAVLSHQIAHASARHGIKVLERNAAKRMAVTGALIATAFVGVPAIPLVALLDPDADSTERLVERRRSVGEEIEADLYGMKYMQAAGYDPRAAVEMRARLLQREGEQRERIREGLFAAHPPYLERLSAARLNAHLLAPDEAGAGSPASDRYAAAMAWLRKAQAAYEACDAGRAAYERGEHDLALAEATRAAEIAPAEPRFHVFLGDMLVQAEHFEEALASYDVALRQDPVDAEAYLRRGLARRALFDFSGARDDFEWSQRLDPSRSASRELRDLGPPAAHGDPEPTAGSSFLSFGPGLPTRMPLASPPPVRLEMDSFD
ncbi:MAG: M48 family metalloprotease [Myxococcales bacterium]|nr:M48 family metalloprotease [Myxococcales bacterium]